MDTNAKTMPKCRKTNRVTPAVSAEMCQSRTNCSKMGCSDQFIIHTNTGRMLRLLLRRHQMEAIIGKLLSDFERGHMTRRQLIQTLALTVTAASAASTA